MNGLYFYKLLSPYKEDVSKQCKLTVNEIDHNFVTLKDADIKSASYDSCSQEIILVRNNGDELHVDLSETLSGVTSDLEVEYDSIDGSITLTYNNKLIKVDGLVTKDNLSSELLTEVISDGTLIGLGAKKSPLGLASIEKTGAFKPAIKFVDTLNGEVLPTISHRKKGDRYVTHETVSKYGFLYNFDAVKKINEDLRNGWRIPTKEDWDNMLNAIEPCDEYRNHGSALANNMLGKYAGKLLKANDKWLKYEGCDEDVFVDDDTFDVEMTNAKTTVSSKILNPVGTDNYGMAMLPSGFYDSYKVNAYFVERGYYWSTTQCNATDVYVKRFDYDKSGVVQVVESPQSYFSIRLVKDYDGSNHHEIENINGVNYETVLMPSQNSELGYTIWTTQNLNLSNECYHYREPNNGENLETRDAYYVNDWNGKEWERKELCEGETIVLLNSLDGKDKEYMLVDGKLVLTSKAIYDEVMDEVLPQLDDINEKLGEGFTDEEGNVITITDKLSDVSDLADKTSEKLGEGFTDEVGNIITVTDKLLSEIEDRELAVSGLTAALENEESLRVSADTKLNERIDEVNSALGKNVQELYSALDAESERAKGVEAELREDLDAESERAKAAEEALSSALDAESERAKGVEAELREDLDAESERAKGVEAELREDLDAEIKRATEEDEEIHEELKKIPVSGLYDSVNGTLTLKTNAEDIEIQLNGNYGTF